jgi:hypothetical protein
MRYIC